MKKIISVILSSVMLLGMLNMTAFAKTEVYTAADSDETEAIYLMKALGFMDDTMEADKEITRAELAQLIARFTGYTEPEVDLI